MEGDLGHHSGSRAGIYACVGKLVVPSPSNHRQCWQCRGKRSRQYNGTKHISGAERGAPMNRLSIRMPLPKCSTRRHSRIRVCFATVTIGILLLVAFACTMAPTPTARSTSTPAPTARPTSTPAPTTIPQPATAPNPRGLPPFTDEGFSVVCLQSDEENSYFARLYQLLNQEIFAKRLKYLESVALYSNRELKPTPDLKARINEPTNYVIGFAEKYFIALDAPQRLESINDDFVEYGNAIITRWTLFRRWADTGDPLMFDKANEESFKIARLVDSLARKSLSLCP